MHTFGVWAPRAQKMQLKIGNQVLLMEGPNRRGWWHLQLDCASDALYSFLVDDDASPYPDPRSLRQPQGVHGPSQLYDHNAFSWRDAAWRGSPKSGAVLYELHIGTFSEEGTFDGAIRHLEHLVDLGVTHVELMPVAEFAGDRGWGYDGVSLFATHEAYGGPDGLKRFVDAAHALGLSVILDVVYNHFGPVGNYTGKFGPYVTSSHRTPWGEAVNLDEAGSDEVRRFFCDNVLMWLRDYHIDGLRFDAVHAFIDSSAVHFMEQLTTEVERLGAALGREFYLIAESDLNDPRVVRPVEAHGYGMDSQWSDDFHHSLFTLLYTNPKEPGYYSDFGSMADLHKALKHAFVYDGQYSGHRRRRHGRPVEGLSAHHFVHFDQNHDQIGNRAFGERLEHLCGVDAAKVALGITLMAPYTPMLFMGEEWAASTPFLYFADHEDEAMRRAVSEGRRKEFAAFGFDGEVPSPEDLKTFTDSKLNWKEVGEGKHADMLAWTRSLIHLRRHSVCLNDGSMHRMRVSSDDARRLLTMQRDAVRIMANLGTTEWPIELLEGEELRLTSRAELSVQNNGLNIPPMTFIVLESSSEDVENRAVQARLA